MLLCLALVLSRGPLRSYLNTHTLHIRTNKQTDRQTDRQAGQARPGQHGPDQTNPDPNRTRSFREDPRVAAANEADIRNRTLTKMCIVDPFADEISLSGAYYGDIPDFDDTPGKQSTMAGIKGLMNNPITNAIGFAINPAFGALKGIAKGIGSLFPDQKRPTQENILGNLGFSINDIGQIVSTGDYDDGDMNRCQANCF